MKSSVSPVSCTQCHVITVTAFSQEQLASFQCNPTSKTNVFMFCIMFYLFLVSLTPVSSPGLNFVHCSFTVHRIFQECSPASGKRFYKVTWQSYEGKGGEMTNGKNLIIQVQQKLNAEYNLIFAATLLFKTWSVAPDTVFLFSRKKHFG